MGDRSHGITAAVHSVVSQQPALECTAFDHLQHIRVPWRFLACPLCGFLAELQTVYYSSVYRLPPKS